MMVVFYPSKKVLKECVGQSLKYQETAFVDEYRSNGTFSVANRPHITRMGREFFAEVTMKDGKIDKVT